MRAPVYRQLGQGSTVLGFRFPEEAGPLLLLYWLVMALPGDALVSGLAWVALALLYRLLVRGTPEGFLRHRLAYAYRRVRGGGLASALARAPQPPFPHGPYRARLLPAKARAGQARPPRR